MERSEKGLTYEDSGVNIAEGGRAVDLIKRKVQETFRFYPGQVVTDIGEFSGVVELADGRVMGLSTDGVGTKLILAQLLGKHDTVGIDLVAMCVNDLIVLGIEPAFFLDYIAMGIQIPERTALIVSGIVEGCTQARVALVGGEMAEMPGMYSDVEYDLAGFAGGFARSREALILGQKVTPGMGVYGLPSSGVHSNGYSLLRKTFGIDMSSPNKARKILETYYAELGCTMGEELLKPTVIYVQEIKSFTMRYEITGMVHVTGGGLVENPPRVLPDGCAMKINWGTWPVHSIFSLTQKVSGATNDTMRKTFNCGLGLLVISPDNIREGILVGEIIKSSEKKVYFE